MHRWHPAVCTLFIMLLTTSQAHPRVDPLQELVEAGRMAEAWAWAAEHRADHEGDPLFDYYYAVAAIAVDRPGEAVFALRRVLALDPGLEHARFHLARAHLALGDHRRARQELATLLAGDPPEPLRAQGERYLRLLDARDERYRTRLGGYLELGAGHDTNVNSATRADSIDLFGQPIAIDTLGEGAQAQSDEFARIAAGLRLDRPLTPALGVFADLKGERWYHAEWTDFEIGRAALRSGIHIDGEATRTTLALRGQRDYLGGDRYRDVSGADASLRHALSATRVVRVALAAARLRHADLEQRDADRWTVAVGTTRLWRGPWMPTLSLTLFHGEQKAREDSHNARAVAERKLYGAGADLRLRVAERWTVTGAIHYRRSDYAEAREHDGQQLFGHPRRDRYYQARLVGEWRATRNWRVQPRLTHAVNDSNIDLHEYDRSTAELRLRYEFR